MMFASYHEKCYEGVIREMVRRLEFSEVRIGSTEAQTLAWGANELIDWVGARIYQLNGETVPTTIRVAYNFDSVLQTPDGRGYVLYERLGTKALLIYDGEILREWNRSFYQADRFDYPINMAQLDDGRQILVHCPEEYNRLEIEDLSTGARLTTRGTESPDFFHSRLQISPDKKWLLSAGWYWHPIDALQVFAFDQALEEPESLDRKPHFEILDQDLEVQSAVFTPDSNILIVTAREDYHEDLEDEQTFFGMRAGQVGLFSPTEKKMLWTKEWTTPPGRVEVDGPWALCLYEHPRLYRWRDWTLVREWPYLYTGKQISSIATVDSHFPAMSFDLKRDRFAISSPSGVTVISDL